MNDYLAAALQLGGIGDSLRDFTTVPALETWKGREELRRRYAYAIPNDEAIMACVRRSPIIEVGAGLGYWASLIAQQGGDIIASDNGSSRILSTEAQYVPVETMDASEAAAKYPDRSLLLIWPPYSEPMAANALRAYAGRTVIYVGEDDGGCTGDEEFHRILAEEWKESEGIAIPQWWGLHDALWIYERGGYGDGRH